MWPIRLPDRHRTKSRYRESPRRCCWPPRILRPAPRPGNEVPAEAVQVNDHPQVVLAAMAWIRPVADTGKRFPILRMKPDAKRLFAVAAARCVGLDAVERVERPAEFNALTVHPLPGNPVLSIHRAQLSFVYLRPILRSSILSNRCLVEKILLQERSKGVSGREPIEVSPTSRPPRLTDPARGSKSKCCSDLRTRAALLPSFEQCSQPLLASGPEPSSQRHQRAFG